MNLRRQLYNNDNSDVECDYLVLYSNVSLVTAICCITLIVSSLLTYGHFNNYALGKKICGARATEVIVLPVYRNLLTLTTVAAVSIGVLRLADYPGNNEVWFCIKWAINRFLTEGLSIFLMHNGVGSLAANRSVLFASIWAVCSAGIPYILLIYKNLQGFHIAVIVILSFTELFYLANWLLPADILHRRPALILLARFNSVVFILMIAAVSIIMLHGDRTGCVVNSLFGVGDLLIPLLIYRTIYHDSLFWQGLFSRGTANLNEPLIGMWDMGRDTMTLVAESISELENEVVPIIPFGQLFVDNSHFFSGGTARVYQGRYKNMDVAIKFLFCIELTPERVVSFCHEASVLNSLQHPNVVKCHGVAVMPPALCLVTEFCSFGSLFDFLHTVSSDMYTTESDGVHSQTVSNNSSRPSLLRMLKGSAKDDVDDSASSTEYRSSDADAVARISNQYTDHSLSRHSATAIMIRPPTSSTVLSVPERYSFSGPLGSPMVGRKHLVSYSDIVPNPNVLDTVNERSQSHFSADTLASAAGVSTNFYNHNITNNIPNTVHETESPIVLTEGNSQNVGALVGQDIPTPIGANVAKPVRDKESKVKIKNQSLRSASAVMRASFLGLGLGPAVSQQSSNQKGSASRQRVSSVGSLKSVLSAGDLLIAGAVNNRGFYLSFEARLKMTYECCCSVAHLHSRGLMHCDIKSLNFLVCSDLSIRLADLGEARKYAGLRVSEMQELPRNINWSAPEVLKVGNAVDVNWRSDIWSLAMVITEILSGEVPFDSPVCRTMTIDQFVDALRHDMRPAVPQKIISAHPWLPDLLKKAWCFDPLERISAGDMASIILNNGRMILDAPKTNSAGGL